MMKVGTSFNSVSDPSPVGLSDEEELRRAGVYATDGMGIGEVLVELDADLAELGIRPDGN